MKLDKRTEEESPVADKQEQKRNKITKQPYSFPKFSD
jgi:hypothetical protein